MKFRKEVIEKIFTYITIILLMGAVAFEAWSVYSERNERKETEERVTSLQHELAGMLTQNLKLQEENKELTAFHKTWATYAAFVGEKEVLYLKTDLFSRTDLIPKEALDTLADWYRAKMVGEEDETAKKDGKKDSVKEREEEEEIVFETTDFSFDNPDGENIFLPLSMAAGDFQSCLIYTTAYGKEDVIELLYEINFETLDNAAQRDENGEILWKCIAFNVGEGWHGMPVEETEP